MERKKTHMKGLDCLREMRSTNNRFYAMQFFFNAIGTAHFVNAQRN